MLDKLGPSDLGQISFLAEHLGLPERVIEKNFFVTRAIQVVSVVQNPLYELIF